MSVSTGPRSNTFRHWRPMPCPCFPFTLRMLMATGTLIWRGTQHWENSSLYSLSWPFLNSSVLCFCRKGPFINIHFTFWCITAVFLLKISHTLNRHVFKVLLIWGVTICCRCQRVGLTEVSTSADKGHRLCPFFNTRWSYCSPSCPQFDIHKKKQTK